LIDNGAAIRIAGTAKRDPAQLLRLGLGPKHRIDLFDTRYFLSNVRQIPELRFFVAYVVQTNKRGKETIYPRIFYKDLSLVWRSASHFAYEKDGDIWVGKGDVYEDVEDGGLVLISLESTTDLPLEIQTALESLLTWTKRPKGDESLLRLILRCGPSDRVEPYPDFTEPRRRAATNPGNLIHRNRKVASFTRAGDPKSLRIVKGYQPDFQNGIIEHAQSRSRMYGGDLDRYRILSANKQIQYLFLAGPTHVWIVPPQATTTELSSYGVRTVDVHADDDLFIPGYEYHHLEENGELYSQIPTGYVGETCPFDDAKADASPWLNELPIIKLFKRQILSQE
jgi:hypothetical protein